MSISGTEWLVILAVIVLVLGRTRVLQLMGDACPADPNPPPPKPGA
ncbi:MAG TPA: hypothetical protein VMO81_14460 [Aestuariivirgaceae bacterium]|nr:hypothetical protein [Aestuariivirgaceae bacterium]